MKKIRICDDQRRPGLRMVLLFLFILMIGVALTSCSGPQVQKSQAKGVYHVVKKGETAFSIARAYSIGLQKLSEANRINDVSAIKEGMVIFIPDANQVIDDVMARAGKAGADPKRDAPSGNGKSSDLPKTVKTPEKQQIPEKIPVTGPAPAQSSGSVPPPKDQPGVAPDDADVIKLEKGKLVWPVAGSVKTSFGIQPNKTYHNWIKITCKPGARVRAAAAGTVIFSAVLKDFGETVIIRHQRDFATVYTHLSKRQVKADRTVKKGEIIALAGQKDEAGDVYINFELRHKGKARNPLIYLP